METVILYSVRGTDFGEDLEAAEIFAQEIDDTRVDWDEYEGIDLVAQGGICVDSQCQCHKNWTNWRSSSVK